MLCHNLILDGPSMECLKLDMKCQRSYTSVLKVAGAKLTTVNSIPAIDQF